jgi:CubicO group peptidase (beta-lactamase class C family)
MKGWCKLLLLAALGLINSKPLAAQYDRVEKAMDSIMHRFQAAGLAVAVVKNNQLIYNHSFGYSNLQNQTPLTNDNIFRIASISKSFTATGIMQLVEAGKLSLQQDISELLGFTVRNPKFPDKVITLKMLLAHRSSLNDKQGYFNLDILQADKNPDWAKSFNDYEPGTTYQYCNLNFNLAGTIIERVSGIRFDNYIVQHIFKPLHLYGGYCNDSLDSRRFATLYEYNKDSNRFTAAENAYHPRREELAKYIMGYSTPVFSPTGGVKISAHDLARYMMMHMNRGKLDKQRIISKKSARQMQTAFAPDNSYGLALEVNTNKVIPGVTLTGHTGSAYGLYSAMFFNPKQQYGFVVITNGCKLEDTDGMNGLLKETLQTLYRYFILN